ncbi:hypothetical protein GOBAR_AA08953 [Gossypium barbadense]|uniref:Uncharacterized protein n=1 Tax=Gossypium barbadense TaxID=3634 RepID=A0A2P5Y7Y2_GOSBA|nr:hypothetical protein GOBAR_AA08953 [Gossypium barbadense]
MVRVFTAPGVAWVLVALVALLLGLCPPLVIHQKMFIVNPSTKKVRFKDSEPISDVEMVVESTLAPTLSWKDMVLGKGFTKSKGSSNVHSTDGNFSLLEGDVKKSLINANSSKEKDLVTKNSRAFDGSMAGTDEYDLWMFIITNNGLNCLDEQSDRQNIGSNGSLGLDGVSNDPLECGNTYGSLDSDVGDKVASINFNLTFEYF